MKLRKLLKDCSIRTVAGDVDVEILGLAYDSREVFPGCVFFAIRGTRTGGNHFIPKAIARRAAAVVSASPPIPERARALRAGQRRTAVPSRGSARIVT